MPYTVTLVRGEQPQANGVELDNPWEHQPVYRSELPRETQKWLDDHFGMDDSEDVWVLITPTGEHVNAVNVIAVHTTG